MMYTRHMAKVISRMTITCTSGPSIKINLWATAIVDINGVIAGSVRCQKANGMAKRHTGSLSPLRESTTESGRTALKPMKVNKTRRRSFEPC